jgi:hypothetical protein
VTGENSLFFDLIERLKLDGKPVSNPTVAACEAAAIAVAMEAETKPNITVGLHTVGMIAAGHMPRSAYQFDQGVAYGITVMLMTEPKVDHSFEALAKRFGFEEGERKSPRGYALQVVSRALAIQPFDVETSVDAAVEALCGEDENFFNGIAFDMAFRQSVFGVIEGLCMALSTEAGA